MEIPTHSISKLCFYIAQPLSVCVDQVWRWLCRESLSCCSPASLFLILTISLTSFSSFVFFYTLCFFVFNLLFFYFCPWLSFIQLHSLTSQPNNQYQLLSLCHQTKGEDIEMCVSDWACFHDWNRGCVVTLYNNSNEKMIYWITFTVYLLTVSYCYLSPPENLK